jgi:hypothetical protein
MLIHLQKSNQIRIKFNRKIVEISSPANRYSGVPCAVIEGCFIRLLIQRKNDICPRFYMCSGYWSFDSGTMPVYLFRLLRMEKCMSPNTSKHGRYNRNKDRENTQKH